MGIRTLIRRTAPTRTSRVPVFAADASTARFPGSSPLSAPLGRRTAALRRVLAPAARLRPARLRSVRLRPVGLGPRSGLLTSRRAHALRRWAGRGRGWLRRPLRGGQREAVRPPA
ncbi:hypothetical protein [Streptomyces graminilatus]|uniref:hypothetical protein n=1 Tax=Streptomyces graminilatus TaxID=1464070 RepID=UPI0012FF3FC7|nr:hypothetical protein [Streptomyces graminilatus]